MPICILFIWALAEAIIWPFMPEALLVPLCLFNPRQAPAMVLTALLGCAVGGWLTYNIAARVCSWEQILRRLPFVRQAMVVQSRQWLASEGSRGVRHQPLSMLPFKVFATTAGRMGLPLLPFLWTAARVRGLRFAIAGTIAAALGEWQRGLIEHHGIEIIVAWSIAFLAALCLMTRRWERRHTGSEVFSSARS